MRFITLCLIAIMLTVTTGCATSLIANTATYETGTDNSSPSVIPVQIGLSGTITADIVVKKLAPDAENTVFLGTSVGLYIVSNGNIQNFIYTPAPVVDIALIDDFTGDGMQETVLCLSTTCFPGVQCYDSSTGKELWHFIPTHEAVIESVGWTDIQTLSVDLETVMDSNADNVNEVVIASGRSLYMVDGKTGKRIWMFEADSVTVEDRYITNNLILVTIAGDVNGDGIADLVSAGQGGFLYIISGKSGRLLRQISLIQEENYDSDSSYFPMYEGESSSTKSINSVRCFTANGRNKAAVSFTGDDVVQLVDLQDGSFGWESSLSYISGDVEVKLSLINDITGDNISDLLALAKTSSSLGISLLNGESGTEIWNTALVAQNDSPEGDICLIDSKKSILVPLGRSAMIEKVAMLNLEDGEIRATLEISSVSTLSPSTQVAKNFWAKGFDNSSFILASNDGDLMRVSTQGDRMWYLPRVNSLAAKKGKFNLESASDILLYCDKVLSARDGLSTEELWHYVVPYDASPTSGGLRFVKVTPDVNSDQYEDILACRGTHILVFNGNTGDVLLDFTVDSQITALDIIRNGNSVALMAGTSTDIFVVTPEGELICSLPYSTWIAEADNFLVLDDINQDGTSDLAITSGNQILLVESSLTGSDLTFVASTTDIQPDGIKAISSSEVVPDIEGDGYRDIYLRVTKIVEKESFNYSIIVSPSSGDILLSLDERVGLLLDPGCADFNNDGYLDSLAFWTAGSQSIIPMIEYGEYEVHTYMQSQRSKLAVISGIDQATLWSYEYGYGSSYYGNQDFIPATPYDIEGSEAPLLAFTEVDQDRDGIELLEVVNVLSNETVKEITVTRQMSQGSLPVNDFDADSYMSSLDNYTRFYIEDTSNQSSPLKLLNDLDGDGSREIALLEQQITGSTSQNGGSYSVEIHPVIVNLAAEEIMSYFVLPCSELIELDNPDTTGMIGSNGLFYILDTISDLEIMAPAEGASLTSPVEISWEGSIPGYFNLIFVDDVLYDVSHQSKTTLELKAGNHKLSVYSLDRYGRVSIQSIDIQVKKQPLYLVLVIVLVIIAFAAVYSARIIRAVDRRHLRKSSQ